ncbi:MAG TPA: DUF6283 family protein [Thermoleophilia bacterium]|nr:DUF6283 family protein [Thermoleophilia bacterium]
MTEPLHVPAMACGTCPYRRDTPSGLWDRSEYEKLPEFDEVEFDPQRTEPYPAPAIATFHCHQENATGRGTVCRGWLSVHRDGIAVRLAQAVGSIAIADVASLPDDESGIYYATGAEACEAGLRDLKAPSVRARRKIAGLSAKGAGRYEDEDDG